MAPIKSQSNEIAIPAIVSGRVLTRFASQLLLHELHYLRGLRFVVLRDLFLAHQLVHRLLGTLGDFVRGAQRYFVASFSGGSFLFVSRSSLMLDPPSAPHSLRERVDPDPLRGPVALRPALFGGGCSRTPGD